MEQPIDCLVEDHPDVVSIAFLRKNAVREVIYQVACFATLGLLYIVYYLNPSLHLLLYDEIGRYEEATALLLRKAHSETICDFQEADTLYNPLLPRRRVRYIVYSYNLYYYEPETRTLRLLNKTLSSALKDKSASEVQPLKQSDAGELLKLYGPNVIRIPEPPLYATILKGFLIPVNVYDCVILLIYTYYQEYIYVIVLAIFVLLQTTIMVLTELNKIAKVNELSKHCEKVRVVREVEGVATPLVIDSKELVIGDVMCLAANATLHCDVLLVAGSCLINEAVLTGESVPVHKTSIDQLGSAKPKNYVYNGSECLLLMNAEVKGVVINTAWSTYKGSLVGMMMNAKYARFKFDRDFMILTAFLMSLFVVSNGVLVTMDVMNDAFSFQKLVVRSLEMVTSTIPPSILFAYYFLTYVTVNRLAHNGVTCFLSDKIQECGRTKHICFDKTGTLTQNKITVDGYILAENKRFEDPVADLNLLHRLDNYRRFVEVMACCHSLNIYNGKIIGDPIEEKMFLKTGFAFRLSGNVKASSAQKQADEPYYTIVPNESHARQFRLPPKFGYSIVRTIDFSSDRKRMSVVIPSSEGTGGEYALLCKGAPETIKQLCASDTIPLDYNEKLASCSEQGFRVLAFAFKQLTGDQLDGEEAQLEKDMGFLGFLLAEDPLKPKTTATIVSLRENNIKCGMITGDNLYTGLSIGYSSGLISRNQDIWVGEYKGPEQIAWSYFHNNDLQPKEKFSVITADAKNDKSALSVEESRLTNMLTKEREKAVCRSGDVDWLVAALRKNDEVVVALDGESFEYLAKRHEGDKAKLNLLLERIVIYGRAKPHHKELAVKHLRKMYEECYFTVGFVGDGSNDCKALNAANLGLSIGNSESSITASFSTTIDDIYPVKEIVVQGKYFLESCSQLYKIAVYSGLVYIFNIILIGLINLNFSTYQYTLTILPWIPTLLLISNTKPTRLNGLYPRPGLINPEILLSIVYSALLAIFFCVLDFGYMLYSERYKPIDQAIYSLADIDYNALHSPIVMYVYVYSSVVQITVQMAFNRGFPFKQGVQTNVPYVIFAITMLAMFLSFLFNEYVEFMPLNSYFISCFNIPLIDADLRVKFLLYCGLTAPVLFFAEKLFQNVYLRRLLKDEGDRSQKRGIDDLAYQ